MMALSSTWAIILPFKGGCLGDSDGPLRGRTRVRPQRSSNFHVSRARHCPLATRVRKVKILKALRPNTCATWQWRMTAPSRGQLVVGAEWSSAPVADLQAVRECRFPAKTTTTRQYEERLRRVTPGEGPADCGMGRS